MDTHDAVTPAPMPRGRINAISVNGAVVVTIDPLTAVDVAEALAAVYRDDPELQAERPWWASDVDALTAAARRAAGAEPTRVDVPILSLVVGGESRC